MYPALGVLVVEDGRAIVLIRCSLSCVEGTGTAFTLYSILEWDRHEQYGVQPGFARDGMYAGHPTVIGFEG